MSVYKSKLGKEIFKTALNQCIKKAWVWNSFENFQQLLQWQNNQKYLYWDKELINNEDDFNDSAVSMDLFAVYSDWQDSDAGLRIDEVNQTWINEFGFSIEEFRGETIEDGLEVGERAREYFEYLNYHLAQKYKLHDFSDKTTFNQALTATNDFLKSCTNSTHAYLFEPAFEYDNKNLKTRCDILKLLPNNHVEIIEVKATSKSKPVHFFDLAYQTFILEKNGFIVDQIFICHLSENYILGVEYHDDNLTLKELADAQFHQYGKITFAEAKAVVDQIDSLPLPDLTPPDIEDDLQHLFTVDPVFPASKRNVISLIEVYRLLETNNYLEQIFLKLTDIMAMDLPTLEQQIIKNPFCQTKLGFKNTKNVQKWVESEIYCSHVMPWFDVNEENIFNFTGSSNFTCATKAEIYWTTGLIYLKDIISLSQLDKQLIHSNKVTVFTEPHYRHFQVYKTYLQDPKTFNLMQTITQNSKPLAELLQQFSHYPIYMYDFETAKWAIPKFNRSKSYQQIPFQYSIDVLLDSNFDYNNPLKTITHYDFLESKRQDPRYEFVKKFLKDIFSAGSGIYVAYNDAFEKTVLKYLAWTYPEYQVPIYYVIQNTVDLMDFFKGKKNVRPWFLIYDPKFRGSYSIKNTQPALDPDFSYKDLKVNKGDKAAELWRRFYDAKTQDWSLTLLWEHQIYKDMLVYCNRDTLAMVVILQKIQEIYNRWEEEQRCKH